MSTQHQESDRERMERLMIGIREFQFLADEYEIDDIFQDNGGKVLQSLILLGLKASPGREGNDAVDASGNEYELKTINVRKQIHVSTHHHLNPGILQKYRKVKAWYISLYEGIELREMYYIQPKAFEKLFSLWESKLLSVASLNNPKIPLKTVLEAAKIGEATRVYPQGNFSSGSLLEQ